MGIGGRLNLSVCPSVRQSEFLKDEFLKDEFLKDEVKKTQLKDVEPLTRRTQCGPLRRRTLANHWAVEPNVENVENVEKSFVEQMWKNVGNVENVRMGENP